LPGGPFGSGDGGHFNPGVLVQGNDELLTDDTGGTNDCGA
jgi:hypothetical protein